ncbi:MAG TPA: FAD-linked oxidase C-terminal domain-containing protein [Thermodesulfobacteriota bacterium]|nr:FAD-linked oxidase C-terminal domain-containing protein [Thermodesulfobacteriota bacterium]
MDYIKDLIQIVGERNVRTDEIERLCYSRDLSVHEAIPDVVVFAKSPEEISKVMALANREKIPVTPRGSGTSAVGGALAAKCGILLDLSRMNNILEIDKENGYVIVEPGVICNQLNAAIAPTHFFPPDPGSANLASLGGMVSTNASGNRALKYGTTKNYVLGLEVVLADGRVINTGSVLGKTSSGYDLTQLFTQAEGTLGIITRIILRILPVPEYVAFAEARFLSTLDAGKAVREILTSGIALSSCEILDKVTIDVVNKAMGLNIPDQVGCLLFIEIDGNKKAVQENIEKINKICKANNGIENRWEDDPAQRLKMWAARQGIVASLSKVKRGSRMQSIMDDPGIPITKIPEAIMEINKISQKHRIPINTFGHIGDGNIHPIIITDPRNKEQWNTVKEVAKDLIDLTIRLRGTLTAEHGTGMAKSPYIKKELGETLEVMKEIKRALDPNNILNPGKMGFDDSIKDIYQNFAFLPLVEKPGEIQPFGEALDNEIMACIMCGFCRAGCPTYGETSLESINARGRVILAYHLLTGRLKPSKELAERFYKCTTCLNCNAVCPAGVKVSDIVQAARMRLVEAGYLPPIHRTLLQSIEEKGNPFGEATEKRRDIYPTEFKPKEKASTLLFFGCVASYQDIHVIPSTLKIMDSAKIDYTALGTEEHCCGYISYLVGDQKEFERSIKNNISQFKQMGIKEIVTTCAGCYRTFKDLYPKQNGLLNIQVYHTVQYLENLITNGKLTFKNEAKIKVAYHDPCDIGRHMNIYDPPRNVIRAIPSVELIEFPQNRNLAKCCGGGGGLKAFDTEMSLEISYKRAQQASGMGADLIVSACPSCKSNLQVAAARLRKEKKGKIKVMDITELVAEALA